MEALYLDTHVAVWLFSGELEKLSPKAVELIEAYDLAVSPMVVLELRFLYEIGKLRYDEKKIIESLRQSIGLFVDDLSFLSLVERSLGMEWTRDPFDRMIVAHASSRANATLLSRDRRILDHYPQAVW